MKKSSCNWKQLCFNFPPQLFQRHMLGRPSDRVEIQQLASWFINIFLTPEQMKVKSRKLQKLPILTFQQSMSYLAGRLLTGYSRLAWIPLHFHTKQQEKIWSNKITEMPTTLSRVCQDFLFHPSSFRFLTWVNSLFRQNWISYFLLLNVATAKFTYRLVWWIMMTLVIGFRLTVEADMDFSWDGWSPICIWRLHM